jgi:short-subunit dehydrogenase
MQFPDPSNAESTLILVTGASRGLGRQIAIACAGRGYRLALVARKVSELNELADKLKDAHDCEAGVFACDLSEPGSAAQCITSIQVAMGPVDVLINNAGIGWYKPFLEHTPEEHERMININFTSVVQLTHAALPAMLEKKRGHIINIASDLSHRALGNMAVYTATKHAMRGLSRSLSQELRGQGIKVTQINPGMIYSSFNDSEEGNMSEFDALKTRPLADLIVQVMEQPGHQMVDEIDVHAMGQDY